MAFIDGDHSYEGVKKDFENIVKYISPKGHILFHDSCSTREFATFHPEIDRLLNEIRMSDKLLVVKEIGSLVHLKRKEQI